MWGVARGLAGRRLHSWAPQRPFSSSVLAVREEVRQALHDGAPVVALESTIISHGMPYPQNLATARQVEEVVRSEGAVPATVALLGSKVHVGLGEAELDLLAETGPQAVKCSRRDMPMLLGRGQVGATTVAGTMVAAHAAGIPMFVTGGIGGVHRGATQTMDVSADLTELGRTPVTVACAGAKSILDLPLTLEYLETQGVPVYGWRTDTFPAFYTASSGLPVPHRVETEEEVAAAMLAGERLGLCSGSVLAVPNEAEVDEEEIERATAAAVLEAEQRGVTGKDATPFLLKRIAEITEGRSLDANIALLLNNARVGTRVAVAHAAARRGGHRPAQAGSGGRVWSSGPSAVSGKQAPSSAQSAPLLVVGGALMDTVSWPAKDPLQLGTSNPGQVKTLPGGVGRNVAEAYARCAEEGRVALLSAVGDDAPGRAILQQAKESGIDTTLTAQVEGARTAAYTALMDAKGELVAGVADTDIFLDQVTGDAVKRGLAFLPELPRAVVADAGATRCALEALADPAVLPPSVPLCFEPTSALKAEVATFPAFLRRVNLFTPSEDEVAALAAGAWRSNPLARGPVPDVAAGTARADIPLHAMALLAAMQPVDEDPGDLLLHWQLMRDTGSPHVGPSHTELCFDDLAGHRVVLVTMAEAGALLVLAPAGEDALRGPPRVVMTPAQPVTNTVNSTGAGDTLAGALLAAMTSSASLRDSLRVGMAAAAKTIQSPLPVSPTLTPAFVRTVLQS